MFKITTRAFAIGLALALFSTTAMAETIKWDLALFGSPAFRVAGESLADYVTKNSNGAFTINVHKGTLSPASEVLDNLSIGAFQLGYVVSSYHPGKNPLVAVLDLPFLPIKTMEQRVAVSEALFENEHVKKEFDKWSTLPLMSVVQPNYEIMGKGKPPKSLDVFDGMRIKATSGIGNALAHFGARLVSMTGAEQYNGLQTGVIDAVAATPSAHGGYKLYELCEWYTVGMDAGTAQVTLVANRDAYQALSADNKALLAKAKEHAYTKTIEAQTQATMRYQPELKKYGLERIDISASMIDRLRVEAAKPIWDSYISDLEAKGMPGQEIFDLIMAEAKKSAK